MTKSKGPESNVIQILLAKSFSLMIRPLSTNPKFRDQKLHVNLWGYFVEFPNSEVENYQHALTVVWK